jgi:hypothetical protein
MHAAIILALALAMPSLCMAKACATNDQTCDPRGQLAFEYLHDRFGDADSALDVWLGHAYGVEGRTRIERRENRLEGLGRWALTLAPADRRAYLGVIGYYEDGEHAAYAEWHTHKLEREQAAYEKHLRECADAARELAASQRPLPRPPEDRALGLERPARKKPARVHGGGTVRKAAVIGGGSSGVTTVQGTGSGITYDDKSAEVQGTYNGGGEGAEVQGAYNGGGEGAYNGGGKGAYNGVIQYSTGTAAGGGVVYSAAPATDGAKSQ